MRVFATVFLLMHVQGNQKLLVCLEEKQCCAMTEQRKQLAHEVPYPLAANATGVHRGRLYAARAWEAVTGSFCLRHDQPEPFRVIAWRALNTFVNLTTAKCVQWNLKPGRSLPGQCAAPGFPVELGGVGGLHAPFFIERRTPRISCEVYWRRCTPCGFPQ
jgi:hypothetical protein